MASDGKRGTFRIKRQVRFGASVDFDEGRVLAEIGARKGATLLPTLRTIWTGATIGQTNATSERRRIVHAGGYTFGVVVALQDHLAGALLRCGAP